MPSRNSINLSDNIDDELANMNSNEYIDYYESNNTENKPQIYGAISTLQQLSEHLSSLQRDYLRTINLYAINSFADNLKSAFEPIKTESINKLINSVSFASQFNLQDSMKPMISAYSNYVKTLNTPLLSESIINAFEKIQLPAFAFSKIASQTPMIDGMTSAMVNLDYSSCFMIAKETLNRHQIAAPDIAFFKTTKLVEALKPQLVYPRGFISSINTLSLSAAYSISKNLDIVYDVSERGFLRKSHDKNVILPNELNSVCAAKEVINSIDEDFISENELMDFMSILFETPSFASSCPAGQKIFQFIQELMAKDNVYKHGFDNKEFYHSRAREKDARPFISAEMLRAPVGITGPGRYNNPGRSHYYFSDSAIGAEAEVRKHNPDKIIQTVKLIPSKPILLLDLSGTMRRGATFLRYLRFPLDSITEKTPREYLIPCYVADCCKRIGFDGIKYYGGKGYSNYVSWNDGYFICAGNV